MNKADKERISKYLVKHKAKSYHIATPVPIGCNICIVIPCHNEPDLIATLESLCQCQTLNYPIEVIIVVNQAQEDEGTNVSVQNAKTVEQFNRWTGTHSFDHLNFHLIEAMDLPKKEAGVGLARKIGMDEALRRFSSIDSNGTIVCLDADCTVSNGYLSAINQEFVNTDAGIGEVYYEHQFELEDETKLRQGIINYELFLRYYVEGLKKAGFSNAIQTVGSCMLVKALVYAKHGGMNKRKAGEDFYFLHKIVPHEKFITVKGGTVFPSCRTSDRVPFGTGKAQQDWLDSNSDTYFTYDPVVFQLLKEVNDTIRSLFENGVELWLDQLSNNTKQFFVAHHYQDKITLILSNCKSIGQFFNQFYIWFDGFLCMKFVHYMRDQHYPNIEIGEAVRKLSYWEGSLIEMLYTYREKDKRSEPGSSGI